MHDKYPSLEEMLKWAEEDKFVFEGEYGDKWSKEDTIAAIKQVIDESSKTVQDNQQG